MRDDTNVTPPTDAALEQAISASLESKPAVNIPSSFAVAVAARAAAMPLRTARPPREYGRTVAAMAAVLLTAVLFALAPFAAPTVRSFGFLAELVVLAQLAVIGYWLVRVPRERV